MKSVIVIIGLIFATFEMKFNIQIAGLEKHCFFEILRTFFLTQNPNKNTASRLCQKINLSTSFKSPTDKMESGIQSTTK